MEDSELILLDSLEQASKLKTWELVVLNILFYGSCIGLLLIGLFSKG